MAPVVAFLDAIVTCDDLGSHELHEVCSKADTPGHQYVAIASLTAPSKRT